jgi:DNA polymerase eta
MLVSALRRFLADVPEFEAVRIGSPDHVPLVVIQWETIIAVNYPARKYGIKRWVKSKETSLIARCSTMGPKEAKELCPDVVIVHTATYRPGETESGYWEDANVLTHKVRDCFEDRLIVNQVSLDPYRRESTKVISIFREMVPKGVVGEFILGDFVDEERESQYR